MGGKKGGVVPEPLNWLIWLSLCTPPFPLALFFFGPPSGRSHRGEGVVFAVRLAGGCPRPSVGGGAVAEGDEEIGGSEGVKEGERTGAARGGRAAWLLRSTAAREGAS